MRNRFTKLDGTTPTTPCEKAKAAYLAHCAAMLLQSENRCTKKKSIF